MPFGRSQDVRADKEKFLRYTRKENIHPLQHRKKAQGRRQAKNAKASGVESTTIRDDLPTKGKINKVVSPKTNGDHRRIVKMMF